MVLKSPNGLQQKQLLAHDNSTSSVDSCSPPQGKTNAQFGEVCGGTTADVAAVCCCCPCGLANLVVLAICKVPAGLYRKAQRQKRLKKQQKKGCINQRTTAAAISELIIRSHLVWIVLKTLSLQKKQRKLRLNLKMKCGISFWYWILEKSLSSHPGFNLNSLTLLNKGIVSK
ncbi:protein MKS1-like [Hibiscus syriacus]|uniref:Protein MKS1-like n=1 Tax=Hibiscus syriacus TaxID=106335 RepID=A0A6A3BGW8_HIBSY|nr:protein MKS1-like [Hibiscus syriacus]